MGRDSQLDELSARLSSQGFCQRGRGEGGSVADRTEPLLPATLVLWSPPLSLSFLALEFACRMRRKSPDCSVFWVSAISRAAFDRAYLQIGQLLNIPGIIEEKANVNQLVKTGLSQENTGPWLLIVDNADDIDVLCHRTDGEPPLVDYLPVTREAP